jgi:hypothetical protein
MTTAIQRFRRAVALPFLTIAALLSSSAHADFSCDVTIQGVLVYYGGHVNVRHSGLGDWTMICNLNETSNNGFTGQPSTCTMWYATLLRAKRNNQVVQFYFPGTGSCATIATYGSSPVPWYVGEAN